MEHQLEVLLEDLYARGREHDQRQADRLDRWRNVEPATARLLALLIRALAPKRMLEIGTSNGYSTIWLAHAAQTVGGWLTSVELDPERAAAARENLTAAGMDALVELRIGDAGAVLSEADDATWSFIFLDAERSAYVDYWPDLLRVLAPRGLLAVDNVISHAAEVSDFRELVSAEPRVTEALAPTGAGALLIVRESD